MVFRRMNRTKDFCKTGSIQETVPALIATDFQIFYAWNVTAGSVQCTTSEHKSKVHPLNLR